MPKETDVKEQNYRQQSCFTGLFTCDERRLNCMTKSIVKSLIREDRKSLVILKFSLMLQVVVKCLSLERKCQVMRMRKVCLK